MIKILLADDHRIIREGLRLIFETEDEFSIVGEAADGEEAIGLSLELLPDIVLMDLQMPKIDGIEAIEILAQKVPKLAIVILTTFNDDELMLRGLRAGARGFLLKDTDRESLFATIRAAYRGETLLKPEILEKLLSFKSDAGSPSMNSSNSKGLTERESEVLNAVAKGLRSKEIASNLLISERTVKAHLASIYSKLKVDSRSAAIAVAAEKGLLK